MKARILIMTILLGALAGCTDTGDSIAREYRNQINESLDAMMLVTDEASAEQMTLRVFKPMAERFKEIDRRLGLVRMNRTKKDFVLEFGLSDSVNMYISEIYLNRGRYAKELGRLKSLAKRVEKAEEEKHANSGSDQPFDPNEKCKNLRLLSADPPAILATLDAQLYKSTMFTLMNEWKDWKLDKLLKKEDLEKIEDKKKKLLIPLGELK